MAQQLWERGKVTERRDRREREKQGREEVRAQFSSVLFCMCASCLWTPLSSLSLSLCLSQMLGSPSNANRRVFFLSLSLSLSLSPSWPLLAWQCWESCGAKLPFIVPGASERHSQGIPEPLEEPGSSWNDVPFHYGRLALEIQLLWSGLAGRAPPAASDRHTAVEKGEEPWRGWSVLSP